MRQNKSSNIKTNYLDKTLKSKKVTHTKREQEWLKENKEAIDEYNKRIEKYGCFSDAYRRF